jgi:DNA-directed RNA polymerase specialized sigma24 family protein
MPDLHSALIELRRASSRMQIDVALRDVLRQMIPLVRRSLRDRLAPVPALAGPHRAVAEVEDLLQEIAVDVWRGLPRYRGRTEAEAEAWVRKIAEHRASDTAKTPLRRHQMFWKEIGLRFGRERKTTRSTPPDDQELLSDGISN